MLGGEIICDLNETPSLRTKPISTLVFDAVPDGGLLSYGGDWEDEPRSFESICGKLGRSLGQQPLERHLTYRFPRAFGDSWWFHPKRD